MNEFLLALDVAMAVSSIIIAVSCLKNGELKKFIQGALLFFFCTWAFFIRLIETIKSV